MVRNDCIHLRSTGILSYNFLPSTELLEYKQAGNSIFTYPSFGREIHVTMKAFPLLAEALETDPPGLSRCQCEVLRIDTWKISSADTDEDEDAPAGNEHGEQDKLSPFAAECMSLARVLDDLANHGHLREFYWTWQSYGGAVCGPILPQVWEALSNNNDLRVMDVAQTFISGGRPHPESWVSPKSSLQSTSTVTESPPGRIYSAALASSPPSSTAAPIRSWLGRARASSHAQATNGTSLIKYVATKLLRRLGSLLRRHLAESAFVFYRLTAARGRRSGRRPAYEDILDAPSTAGAPASCLPRRPRVV